LLAETLADEPDPAVMRTFAERIVRESERLARIVDDLLDLSVIESDGTHSDDAIALDGVVRDAVEQVRGAAEVVGNPIDVDELPPDLVVAGDRRQLVSAVYNLLDNAVKYSDPMAPIEVSLRKESGDAEITIRDHGIGIPTRDIERIFERFYRVDRARSRETGGTGLGLSIVRHVVAVHGGDVRVESHEGEGSTFTITLPLRTSDSPQNQDIEHG
jgi:two-component system sensor histidine kinase SenX3